VNFSFILPLICLAVVALYGYSTFKASEKIKVIDIADVLV
jgi:FHS family L-fucose permease-like MFS transporter